MPSPDNPTPLFLSTQWSAIRLAGDPLTGDEALTALCQAYWYPIYFYIRRHGHRVADAEDLTQTFFARMIETRSFQSADPEKGKFRFYLLGCLKHFLANAARQAATLKRGHGQAFVSFEEMHAEERYQTDVELSSHLNPEACFEKRWGETMVAITFQRLEDKFNEKGKGKLYKHLSPHLSIHSAPGSYAGTAEKLGLSDSAVKSAIHRLRQSFAETFREEVSRTLDDQADVDEEIRYLIQCLSR